MILKPSNIRTFSPIPSKEERKAKYKKLGLGDAVAAVAQPVAKAIDLVLGTDLQNCIGCIGAGGRKDTLNKIVPDLLHPFSKPDKTE